MKFVCQSMLVVCMFLIIVSCASGDDGPLPGETRTVEDVRNDFQNLNVQPGVNDFDLESLTPGVFWKFRVIAPVNSSPSNVRPLVMTFHGASGGSTTAHMNTECYDEPGLAALDAFIISPNAGQGEWYDQSNQLQVIALIDLAKAFWDVDPNKVVATGYSNGGNASWFYAEFFPDLFSAAIPMASSYDPRRDGGEIPEIQVPLYVIHGENDELFSVGDTQHFVELSRGSGSSIEFVVADGLSHLQPCEYVSYLQDAATWLLTEVWN